MNFKNFSMYYVIIEKSTNLAVAVVVIRPGVSRTLLHFGSPNDSHYKDTKAWWCLFLVMNSTKLFKETEKKFSVNHRTNLSSHTPAVT